MWAATTEDLMSVSTFRGWRIAESRHETSEFLLDLSLVLSELSVVVCGY